ncbi:hypothetical protein N9018_04615, partial [Rhodopirellula sp.]|nr:hypothetical protein [Rhodopirellula sp.]
FSVRYRTGQVRIKLILIWRIRWPLVVLRPLTAREQDARRPGNNQARKRPPRPLIIFKKV